MYSIFFIMKLLKTLVHFFKESFHSEPILKILNFQFNKNSLNSRKLVASGANVSLCFTVVLEMLIAITDLKPKLTKLIKVKTLITKKWSHIPQSSKLR